MVTMAQSAAKWRNTHMDRTHSSFFLFSFFHKYECFLFGQETKQNRKKINVQNIFYREVNVSVARNLMKVKMQICSSCLSDWYIAHNKY